jgi:hypothetical protein
MECMNSENMHGINVPILTFICLIILYYSITILSVVFLNELMHCI